MRSRPGKDSATGSSSRAGGLDFIVRSRSCGRGGWRWGNGRGSCRVGSGLLWWRGWSGGCVGVRCRVRCRCRHFLVIGRIERSRRFP